MNKIYLSLLLLIGLSFTSCLDDNIDPNAVIPTSPDQIFPTVLFYASQTQYDHAEYGVFLSQALTTAGRSQTGSLAYKSGWEFLTMNRHPQWRRHFYDIGSNSKSAMDAATAKESHNYELVLRTIKLMSTLYTTDMFGPMPNTKAIQGTPAPYESQEEIYKWMESEIEVLLADYDNTALTQHDKNLPMGYNIDRIYGGDLNKWKRFTLALKARLYLRKLPNWERTPENCAIIIKAVDAAMADGGWVEPNYSYVGNEPSRTESNCPWGPSQAAINTWESRKNQLDQAIPSKFFSVDMLGVGKNPSYTADDPRYDKLMKNRPGPTGDANIKARYLENNIGMGASYTVLNYPNLFYINDQTADIPTYMTRNDASISLMLTEELLLIKAEAQYWNGDKNAAYETTVLAMRSNMARHGVVEARIKRYLALPDYLPQAGFDIGHLMRQKYVCMYLQPEQWTDMRRYKYSNSTNKIKHDGIIIYPTLRRPYNLYEAYWLGDESWVQRINYDPETEEKYNRPELERLGAYKNPDWLKKPMIWAQ